MVQLPHSKTVLGSNPPAGWGLSAWSLHVQKGPTAVLPPDGPSSVTQWGLSMTYLLKPQFVQ